VGIEVKLDPETSPEARYGYELRKRRKEAGLTLAQLGDRVALTGQQIGNIERADRRMKPGRAGARKPWDSRQVISCSTFPVGLAAT
jgi:hypothetical protein